MNYTEEQIKAAFWKTFHKRGEVFFPYPSMAESEEECERETTFEWADFAKNLEAELDNKVNAP